LTNPYYLRNG